MDEYAVVLNKKRENRKGKNSEEKEIINNRCQQLDAVEYRVNACYGFS